MVPISKHGVARNNFKRSLCSTFSLDALDPNAYEAFQASNNLSDVVQRCLQKKKTKTSVLPGMSKKLSIRASLMTPVKPMLVSFKINIVLFIIILSWI